MKKVKSAVLTAQHDQLKEREEVAKIIREELMSQLEGGDFWSELKEIIALGHANVSANLKFNKGKAAAQAPIIEAAKEAAQADAPPARKRGRPKKAKVNGGGMSAKMKKRGELVRKIMKERGVSLAEASAIIKKENLI